jgi:putative heme-binding domain-containing protein
MIRVILFCLVLIFAGCSEKSPKQVEATGNPKIDKLKVPQGFRVEHLYNPSEKMNGSWVSLAFDNKDRLIASDQYGSLYRMDVTPLGTDSLRQIEKLRIGHDLADSTEVQMGFAQGLLYAFNSLYVMVNNYQDGDFKMHSGLYRLQDTDNDDQYDKVTLLKELDGAGEHGPHSVILSPDKKSIYVIAGNHTDLPKMNSYLLPAVWQEDNLFPLIKDPRGHANDRYAPGGWIARTDSLGKKWELVSAGYRNAFDIAFNEDGELFTYDSDMEWDFGMPWYRPTRICHVTSGSEYGWRTGNSKWSPSWPDNLPPVINIGQGSPTNLVHGMNSGFPDPYKKALFAFDWSFGIIYAMKLKSEGSTYSAEPEEFLSGSPLPLTDGVFGPDGALYFVTGGRRLESDLYRIYYDVGKPVDAKSVKEESVSDNLNLRRKLETFHRSVGKEAVDFAWPYLNHNDRFIRYAARVAVEHQPITLWQNKALKEKATQAFLEASIALAHHAKSSVRTELVNALTRQKFASLAHDQKIDLLRAMELVILRMGELSQNDREKIASYLSPHFPSRNNSIDRCLSKILVHIEAEGVVEKTLDMLGTVKDDTAEKTVSQSSDLIFRNPQYGLDIAAMLSKIPPAQQTYFATVLMNAKSGWTPELHEKYFQWFRSAFNYKGGVSYVGFINKAREAALKNVPKNDFDYYNKLSGQELLTQSGNDLASAVEPKGPWREWSLEQALTAIDSQSDNPDLENGKLMFEAVRCKSCHIMHGEGGIIGPDLSHLGTRFSNKDILESILEPNKAVSDQYAATVFAMKDGSSIVGKLVSENDRTYSISQNPFAPQVLREISKEDVMSRKYSHISIMYPGLINPLNEKELANLIAYLKSGGNQAAK